LNFSGLWLKIKVFCILGVSLPLASSFLLAAEVRLFARFYGFALAAKS
jgi:hypothetical protein